MTSPEFQAAVAQAAARRQRLLCKQMSSLELRTLAYQKVVFPRLLGGDLLEWQGFWDIFESSVDKQDLPKVAKFNYLRGTLKGQAATALTGIAVTNENYDLALKIRHFVRSSEEVMQ